MSGCHHGTGQMPRLADEIYVSWRTVEGGIGAIACTDEACLPYIGLMPLSLEGKPNGWPLNFQSSRITGNVVVGYQRKNPVTVFIDAEVTVLGLVVQLRLHEFMAPGGGTRRLFAPWGSDPPTYRLMGYPNRTDWWENVLLPRQSNEAAGQPP